MSKILAIDPGDKQSGYVVYNEGNHQVDSCGVEDNHQLLGLVDRWEKRAWDEMVIENITSYGMPVGESTFATTRWIGRFSERCYMCAYFEPTLIPRQTIKSTICGSAKAKDANIRQALLDMFPKTGGGQTPQVGIKANPGPLYGFKSHIYSALAVAITYSKIKEEL